MRQRVEKSFLLQKRYTNPNGRGGKPVW